MKKIRIKRIDEDIYYEKLENGLKVFLYTKDNINNNNVTFTTMYGSTYNQFIPIGKEKSISVPKGIAHFLEHKVFAQKEDPQPMDFFAKSGTNCNAYTTFKNTTYLFNATSKLGENINFLLDYVQNLYLTPKSIESEKGIIAEEIHMYEDRPWSVLMDKTRANTLTKNPYKDSIIGTVKDIESITKDDLETCYQTFYHPSNMFVVISGNFNPKEIISLIRNNQNSKDFLEIKNRDEYTRNIKEPDTVSKDFEEIFLNTNVPKVSYVVKVPLKNIQISRRKLHLYIYILFSSLFDETSYFDEEMKKENVINNTTVIDVLNCDSHLLIAIINETEKYNTFIDNIKKRLTKLKISDADFERKKKVLISNEIMAYEYSEMIGKIILDNIIYEDKIEEDPIGIIESLNTNELNELITLLNTNNTSTVIIRKKGQKDNNIEKE